jgi:hypothetical protein
MDEREEHQEQTLASPGLCGQKFSNVLGAVYHIFCLPARRKLEVIRGAPGCEKVERFVQQRLMVGREQPAADA